MPTRLDRFIALVGLEQSLLSALGMANLNDVAKVVITFQAGEIPVVEVTRHVLDETLHGRQLSERLTKFRIEPIE